MVSFLIYLNVLETKRIFLTFSFYFWSVSPLALLFFLDVSFSLFKNAFNLIIE